jgi:spoIIIJ-associated protein
MNQEETANLIKELLEKTTVAVNGISVEEEPTTPGKSKTTWFSIQVEEPRHFLGRGGEALSALNHLVRRIIETKAPGREDEILIDINDFQKKRVENVRAVAHMMAERARYFKSNIEVDPMPAFERRIVHEFLSEATDLKTESEGVGLSRRVVIKYLGSL